MNDNERRLAEVLLPILDDLQVRFYGALPDGYPGDVEMLAGRLVRAGVRLMEVERLEAEARLADHASIEDGPAFARGIRYAVGLVG